jgi:hypothetical protein
LRGLCLEKKNNPGVTNLTVAVQEETVTISGMAKDAAAFEKSVLIAGNVEGSPRLKRRLLVLPGIPVSF